MQKHIVIFIVFLILPLCILHAKSSKDYADAGTDWLAGVARVKITPQHSMWMAGYGSRDQPSEGTLHDIWAKALALEDANGNQAVLITADIIRWPKRISDQVRNRLEQKYGLTRAQILLNASHTHTGPELDVNVYKFQLNSDQLDKIEQYADRLENQIIELVGEALQSLQPARISAENGVARFAVNRRNNPPRTDNPARTLEEAIQMAGPSDHAVPVLKIENLSGYLIGIAFGYACHPTVLNDYNWSGDYAGFAQLEIESKYPGVTALFFQGAGADSNPLPRRSVALAEQYGEMLAAAVSRVISEEMRLLDSKLSMVYSEVDLPFKNPPDRNDLLKLANGNSNSPEDASVVFNSRIILDHMGESDILTYPYPVQVWQLGNQSIMSFGGELVVDYAVQLKRIFGQDLFVLGYSNDSPGYIPSARIIQEGGYEGERPPGFVRDFISSWHPAIEAKILNEAIKLSNEVRLFIPD